MERTAKRIFQVSKAKNPLLSLMSSKFLNPLLMAFPLKRQNRVFCLSLCRLVLERLLVSMFLSDIVHVYRSPSSDSHFVQIRFRVTKWNPNWSHVVTLEGKLDHRSPLNFV